MLAPTRELVSQLNQRARAHRLATEPKQNRAEAWRWRCWLMATRPVSASR